MLLLIGPELFFQYWPGWPNGPKTEIPYHKKPLKMQDWVFRLGLDRKWSNFPPCAGLVQLLTCLSEQFCKHYHGLGASSLTELLTPGGSGSVQEVPINHSPNHMIIATFQQKKERIDTSESSNLALGQALAWEIFISFY